MKRSLPQVFQHLINKLPLFILTTVLTLPSLSHSAVISDLIITEIMANPSAVSDSNGEWFELYNPSNDIFDFNGITLSDNSTTGHLINDSTSLFIQPGEYFVFGRNDNELENGGYIADYEYSSFILGNSDDEIILSDMIGNILSLEYDRGDITNGHSLELISPDMTTFNYAVTMDFNYGDGDFGTPGAAGSYQFDTASVPEPSTALLLLSGIVFMRRKMKSKR